MSDKPILERFGRWLLGDEYFDGPHVIRRRRIRPKVNALGATEANPVQVAGSDLYGETEEYADGGGGFIPDRGQYDRAAWRNVPQHHIRMGDGLENLPEEDDHQNFRDWLAGQR